MLKSNIILGVLILLINLSFSSSLGVNIPEPPTNYSLVNVNNSQYLQGLTPQQVADLYIETDPNYFSNPNSYYNYSTLNLSKYNQQAIIVGGKTRAIKYIDSSNNVVRIDIYDDATLTDYSDATTEGSIQWAINTLGNNGGLVFIYSGIYNLTNSIVIDYDWITLQGSNRPHWNAYTGAFPTLSNPGTPGGAQLKASAGKNAITIGTTTANMHGDTRHKGIALRDLYLYGQNSATYGIYDTLFSDIMEVSGCLIQGFQTAGISITWDASQIRYNNIQSNNGWGIETRGALFQIIQNNIIYDGGGGIHYSGPGGIITGNTIGRVDIAGIQFYGTNNANVYGNTLKEMNIDPDTSNPYPAFDGVTDQQLIYGNDAYEVKVFTVEGGAPIQTTGNILGNIFYGKELSLNNPDETLGVGNPVDINFIGTTNSGKLSYIQADDVLKWTGQGSPSEFQVDQIGAGGSATISIANRQLLDTGGNPVLDWNTSTLNFEGNDISTSGSIISDNFASYTNPLVTMQFTTNGIGAGEQGWIYDASVQYQDIYNQGFAFLDYTAQYAVLVGTPYANWDTLSRVQINGKVSVTSSDYVTPVFSTIDDSGNTGSTYIVSGRTDYLPQSVFGNPFGSFGLQSAYLAGGIGMAESEAQIYADRGDTTYIEMIGMSSGAVTVGDSTTGLYLLGTGVNFPDVTVSIPKLVTSKYFQLGSGGTSYTPVTDGSTLYYNGANIFRQYLGKRGSPQYMEQYIMSGSAVAGSTDKDGGKVTIGNPNDYATATGNGKSDVTFNIVNANQGTGTTARYPKEVAKFSNGGLTIADTHSLGAELVPNGDFSSDTAWTKSTGVVIADGVLKKTSAGTGTTYPTTPLTIVAGKTYLIEFDRITGVPTSTAPITTIGGVTLSEPSNMGSLDFSTFVHYYETFTALNTDNLVFNQTASGGSWQIDNVSVREITGGNEKVVGNVIIGGNITGNNYYGGMWFDNDTTNGQAMTIASPNTWYNITMNTTTDSGQDLNGFTFVNGNALKCFDNGLYEGSYSVSFETSGINKEYNIAVSNGTDYIHNSESHSTMTTNADSKTIGSPVVLRCSPNLLITLQVRELGLTGNNIGIHHAKLFLKRLAN